METVSPGGPFSFDHRFRRTNGRTERVYSATAKLTRAELDKLTALAASQGKSVSEWTRDTLLAAAAPVRTEPDLLLVELVATRSLIINMLQMIGRNMPITEVEYAKLFGAVQEAKRRVAGEVVDEYSRRNPAKER
jgi:hypothetical protein